MKTNTQQEWDKQEQERERYRKVLRPHALNIANAVCASINKDVPESVPSMRYARQWVLEEAIKLLQDRV